MALDFEKGTFSKANATTQTITLNNGSLTPKAVILWGNGSASGAGFNTNCHFTMGFATRRGGSTQEGCIAAWANNAAGTSSAGSRRSSSACLTVMSGEATLVYTASLTAFAAGSFSLSYSASSGFGTTVHYLVIGGADLTDAIVLNHVMASTGATEAITGAGFQPSALFALDASLATADSFAANAHVGFGFATSSARCCTMSATWTDGDSMTTTMNYNRGFRTNGCLQRLLVDGDTIDAAWDLDSFDSDGATLGVLDAPSATDQIATFLFLQGGQWDCGSQAKDTATGADTITQNESGLTAKGVLLFCNRMTGSGITVGQGIDFFIGVSDGTRQGGVGICTGTESDPINEDRLSVTDAVIEEITGGATPAETSVATLSSFSAGSFDINWSVNGGAAPLLGWIAVGDSPATDPTPPTGSLSLTGLSPFNDRGIIIPTEVNP